MIRLFLALAFSAAGLAQEPIRFARSPDISPDGKVVAFSYLGDVWTVEAIGGVARPVTMHEAHDVTPLFSPDGRSLAFASNRHGQYDVFVSPVQGGKPRRLTFDSANDYPVSWSADGKSVVFSSGRSTEYPYAPGLYSIPVEGGREKKLPHAEAKDASFHGTRVAFVRGEGTWYRKNYRGSSNDDLWLANADGSGPTRLTAFAGQDTAPSFSPDGKRLYYVSEHHGGPANVVCQELNGVAPVGLPKPVTSHKDDSVRKARLSRNGEWVVYECGADLWVASTKDGAGRKLAIEVHADDKSNTEKTLTYTRDLSEYALSPDENSFAIVVHGEVFAMPTKGGKANRITDTPAVEHGVAWSPDNKKLVFVSDRNGFEELYVLESDDPDTTDLTKASRFKTKAVTNTPEAEWGATFSPDGARIVFIRSGKLWSMKADGTEPKAIVDTPEVFDYDWSPDGKWLVYSRADGSYASELYVMPSDGGKPAVNVTRYATVNADVSWGGNHLAFVSQRVGGRATHVLNLQKPGTGGGTDIDFEDIHLRTTKIGTSATSVCINRNGKMVAFRGNDDLWVSTIDGSSMNRLTTGGVGPQLIRWTKGGTIHFLDNNGSLRSASPGLGTFVAGTPTPPGTVNFTAKLVVRQDQEFTEIFDQSWRLLSESFYDEGHHGANWKAVREKYRGLVKHVAMKEDLYNLVSLMLGELNASHLGISGNTRWPEEVTADLGVLFDDTFAGPGLKVAEVLKRGPADKRGVQLAAGDVILSIDRSEITPQTNLSKLLNAKVGETVLLEVTSNPADPKAKRKVELQGANRGVVSKLMYDRWVDKNAAAVALQSGGKVGYIHIPSMNEAGLEQFVRSLYSDNFGKEGIVIDVRNNGGGFTHDQVLNYLGAKEHTFFRQRGGAEGLVMRNYDRKWTKPTTVLINNRSYSDAEIFPAAYRQLGLGKVVGQATGGLVISTRETTLIDGSTFRLPTIGVWTARGVNMEKEGVSPDIAVDALPEDLAKGTDAQLKRAVEVLGVEVAEWKKSRGTQATAGGK